MRQVRETIFLAVLGACLTITGLVGPAWSAERLGLNQMQEWVLPEPGQLDFVYEDFRISVERLPEEEWGEDFLGVELTIQQKGRVPFSQRYDSSFFSIGKVGIFEFDRYGGISLIFESFTGGAHCCMSTHAIYLGQDDWVSTELGMFDGDPYDPEDVDGDGLYELVVFDQRFNYTFDAYAFSAPPPMVIATSDGTYADLSAQVAFLSLMQEAFNERTASCLGSPGAISHLVDEDSAPLNSACASVMALGARLGIYEGVKALVETMYAGRIAADYDFDSFTFYFDDEETEFDNLVDAADFALGKWGYLD